jgi:hypothetical protein
MQNTEYANLGNLNLFASNKAKCNNYDLMDMTMLSPFDIIACTQISPNNETKAEKLPPLLPIPSSFPTTQKCGFQKRFTYGHLVDLTTCRIKWLFYGVKLGLTLQPNSKT